MRSLVWAFLLKIMKGVFPIVIGINFRPPITGGLNKKKAHHLRDRLSKSRGEKITYL